MCLTIFSIVTAVTNRSSTTFKHVVVRKYEIFNSKSLICIFSRKIHPFVRERLIYLIRPMLEDRNPQVFVLIRIGCVADQTIPTIYTFPYEKKKSY